MKKAAAILTAGLMAAASLGAEAFAESGNAAKTTDTVTVAYEATVAKPTYTVKGSKGVRKIKLSTTTTGATIYYTTNGTTPSTSSRKYTTGTLLKITKDVKIKAIAVYGSSQSAVMTKTFKVNTLYGDVTGDGNINQNDFARLTNYFNNKTSYICKDNADCNGSGGLARNDLTVLSQYLAGTITRLPYSGALEDEEDPEEPEDNSSTSTTVTTKLGKPGITVYKSLGGKKIEFTSSTSGVTFYYTLDGSTPTTRSTRYTDKFLIDTAGTKTVKVIAYKNGVSSDVQQTSVSVGTTQPVGTSASTSQIYSGSVSLALTCTTTGSSIFYTLDGSDPRTSNTTKTYYSPITVSPTTSGGKATVRAYARSKANADSTVSTFDYNFTADFTISGNVWNDTPSAASVADGIRATNETGVQGIRVLALNTITNTYVKETTTDNSGNYSLTGLAQGTPYKVVFQFNDQKYRPYTSIVYGGNQALLSTTIPAMVIRNGGAYNTTNTILANVNNYTSATTNSAFNANAVTSADYRATTNNVNLALCSNIYGALSLTITTTTSGTSNTMVKNDDRIVYTVTLTNNSPVAALSDVTLGLYISDVYVSYSMVTSTGYTVSANNEGTNSGIRRYGISNLLGSSSLAPGKSISFTFTGYVQTIVGTRITCAAEVTSYRFANSVFDQHSVPGNMNNYTKRENDEATATVLTVNDGTSSTGTNSTISVSTRSFTIGQGQECEFDVLISNISSTSDYIISPNVAPATLVTWTPSATQMGDNILLHFNVKANSSYTQGVAYFTVYLKADTRVNTTVSVTVVR